MTDETSASSGSGRINPFVMLLVVGLALLLVFGFGMALLKSNLAQLEGGLAPDFEIDTYDGKTFKLDDHLGHVVLINFWASWCGPCRSEAPDLNALWTEYKDRGVTFIGVGYLDNEKDARGFLKEFGIKYPTGSDNGTEVSNKYRVKGVPETYIVDQKGNLVMTFPGSVSAEKLREVLDRLLANEGTS